MCSRRCHATFPKEEYHLTTQPIFVWLEYVQQGVLITNIAVGNVTETTVADMLSDVLKQRPDHCEALAKMVHQQTHGNVFFVLQVLRSLSDEGWLHRDTKTGQWVYNGAAPAVPAALSANQLQQHDASSLVRDKMLRLDKSIQDTLLVASCLGSEFEEALLQHCHVDYPMIQSPFSQTGEKRRQVQVNERLRKENTIYSCALLLLT